MNNENLKIGALVRAYIKRIFFYCDNNPNEINRLLEEQYSKDTFGINYPFCTEIKNIEPSKNEKYYVTEYTVQGKKVRVTNDWFKESKKPFISYLTRKMLLDEVPDK